RITDREMELASEYLWQVEFLLLFSAELHDGRRDRVHGQHRHWSAGAHRFVEEDELLDRRHAATAVFLRPPDTQPAVGSHLQHHLAHRRADSLAAPHLLENL